MITLTLDEIAVLLYYSLLDTHSNGIKAPVITTEVLKRLATLGFLNWLKAPYPYAPSHAHITREGRAYLESAR